MAIAVFARSMWPSRELVEAMRGFHWMTSYGDYLREVEYAVKKAGVSWVKI